MIDEDIDRESMHDDEYVDDATSSLSKELLMAKQINQGPKQAFMTPGTNKTNKSKALDLSIGKGSMLDSDVDGLINWAKDLPDDISVGAGQSFYGMLNKTLTKK